MATYGLWSMRFQRVGHDWETKDPGGDLPDPGTELVSHVSCIGGQILYHCATTSIKINIVKLKNKKKIKNR